VETQRKGRPWRRKSPHTTNKVGTMNCGEKCAFDEGDDEVQVCMIGKWEVDGG